MGWQGWSGRGWDGRGRAIEHWADLGWARLSLYSEPVTRKWWGGVEWTGVEGRVGLV